MGNCCLPIQFRRTPSAVNPKNVTLLLLGLDNSGKTTIVKRLAGEPLDSVVPTVGFSVVFLRQKGCQVSVYDLGGGPQIRDIWPRYYADAHGIIFVIDAHDIEKMETCREVFKNLLQNDQISGKPVLLLANKQDLEGALDEIDIVDRLNLEKVVNEQKCPTLVELCSALNFSKKIDIGIENGYKWLIRSIIRDYPSLNNRVLKDLAKQEEGNKVKPIKRVKRDEGTSEEIFDYVDGNPFKPVKKVLEEKIRTNGYTNQRKSRSGIKTIAVIPGLVDETLPKIDQKKTQTQTFFGEEIVSMPESPAKPAANTNSSDFFMAEKFQSDLELLNDVPNHPLKNYFVRPKSSGARLYGVKSEKKRTHRRKPLRKKNKTGPTPFTDLSNGQNGQIPRALESGKRSLEEDKMSGNVRNLESKVSLENVNPFGVRDRRKGENYEMKVLDGSKSMPNSRRNSVSLASKRRHSVVNGTVLGLDKVNMGSRINSNKEIILDVTKLGEEEIKQCMKETEDEENSSTKNKMHPKLEPRMQKAAALHFVWFKQKNRNNKKFGKTFTGN